MKLEELKNKKMLIVGRGIEGTSAFAYLKKHFPENIIEIVDQKDGKNYLDKQKDFDIAIKSPNVKSELLTIPYTTATNIFLSNAKGKVIGVTGTKGKSTTSTLIYEMLKYQYNSVYFGGNIGQCSLDFLDKLNDHSWTVLEMSSFQLKDLKISPHVAVVLMITSEHLDYHESLKDYVDAKRNILRFQKTTDIAVINRDYPASNESDIFTDGKVFRVSRERECEEGCFVREGNIILNYSGNGRLTNVSNDAKRALSESSTLSSSSLSESRSPESVSKLNIGNGSTFSSLETYDQSSIISEVIIKTEELLLPGEHNWENACAAVMAATLAGVSKENMVKVLKTFKGLPHRLEFVGEKDGIKFINDSLSTIPEAAIQAIETFKDAETLIAGGYDRGLDFTEFGKYLAKSNIKTLILFPTSGDRIWQAVCDASPDGKRPEKFDATSMEQAVRIAFAETTIGKTCLLSPASASFGIFKDYKDRGEQFKREVEKLAEKASIDS